MLFLFSESFVFAKKIWRGKIGILVAERNNWSIPFINTFCLSHWQVNKSSIVGSILADN